MNSSRKEEKMSDKDSKLFIVLWIMVGGDILLALALIVPITLLLLKLRSLKVKKEESNEDSETAPEVDSENPE